DPSGVPPHRGGGQEAGDQAGPPQHGPRPPAPGGLEPGPRRGDGTWDAFVRRHAQSLWACDFFTKKVWTRTGLVDVFLLFFLHVGSRRVFLAGMSARPDAAWVGQQARTAVLRLGEEPVRPRIPLR